ncbi:DUF3857 domain-containing transglutaminase family protein [Massilia sp. DD77]|uniref:DUF3857 domain-containing transglutaminase family protein n=1 Tax=Massilia sp. DD77 TaxID=3109349 RepID=UPI003000491C
MSIRLVALLWLLLCAHPAFGRDTGTDHSVIVDRYVQHFVVEPDGSYLLTVEQVKTLAAHEAVRDHAQYYIGYNQSLDAVVAIDAHTEKADGRRLAVQPHQIRDQQESASVEAPMFQDTRLKIIVFPDVQPGDRVAVRYVLRRHTPLFPGQFEDLSSARFHPHRDYRLIYDMPPGMTLYADAAGFAPQPDASPPGRRRYQWRYVDGENARIELDSVSYLDYGKRLAVSTFPDYAAFARAYHARAAAKALPNTNIAALAASVTRGIADPQARAVALSNWVRRNIRYVGVYLGPGGVVPHEASSVLINRYGDCKDHAALLEALLRASGIEATAGLVNNGDAYRLPEVPTLGVLNHAIVYIPALQLFLDPTAESVAGGFLPPALLGKPVLLSNSGAFAMTPSWQPSRSRTSTRFDILADGSSRFKVTRTSSGASAEPYRRVVRATPQAERERFVERMLQGLGQQGAGVFEPGDTDGASDDYTLSFSGSSGAFAHFPGPVGLATTYNFWGGLGDAVSGFIQEPERRQDFVCPAIDAEDELQFRLPPRARVLALPRPLAVEDGNFAYRSRYARRGNTVSVTRRLQFRHTQATCSPDDYRRMRPALERIMRDLRTQVVIEKS